jgi:hypothetical protein
MIKVEWMRMDWTKRADLDGDLIVGVSWRSGKLYSSQSCTMGAYGSKYVCLVPTKQVMIQKKHGSTRHNKPYVGKESRSVGRTSTEGRIQSK